MQFAFMIPALIAIAILAIILFGPKLNNTGGE